MFGIKRQRRQDVLVLTGFRAIEDVRLAIVETGGHYGTNERSSEAWAINDSLQLKDRETGKYVQFVTGWSCNPVDLFGYDDAGSLAEKDIWAIAARVTDEALNWFEKQKQKHTLLLWAGIIGVILALGVVIPIATGIMNGSIKVPIPHIGS